MLGHAVLILAPKGQNFSRSLSVAPLFRNSPEVRERRDEHADRPFEAKHSPAACDLDIDIAALDFSDWRIPNEKHRIIHTQQAPARATRRASAALTSVRFKLPPNSHFATFPGEAARGRPFGCPQAVGPLFVRRAP
jgi:hypothetical protein